mmetsp:Transcript_10553/g.18681  ORF Transcript_10553/g.18681 Transcript_10553/m.18681 type:complete len:93 (+) Transcript_10553:1679-1957(+)
MAEDDGALLKGATKQSLEGPSTVLAMAAGVAVNDQTATSLTKVAGFAKPMAGERKLTAPTPNVTDSVFTRPSFVVDMAEPNPVPSLAAKLEA